MAEANASGGAGYPNLPEGLLSIAVADCNSSLDGIDYEVTLKTHLACFPRSHSVVRRTQQEFEWLCRQMNITYFKVPFGESEDVEGDMHQLQSFLYSMAADPVAQREPVLRCFLSFPLSIPLDLTAKQLQEEADVLTDCTEDRLEDMSMEDLRGLCLRHGLSAVASYTDRDYFVEKILTQSQRQLQTDLDVLEKAMKSLDTKWDVELESKITDQPVEAISLPEIEAALLSLENTAGDVNDVSAYEDVLPPRPMPPLDADLPQELLDAMQLLENPCNVTLEDINEN